MIRLPTLIVLFGAILPALAQDQPCLYLENDDHISGKDLARALPEFGALPADTILSSAPTFGAERIFPLEEIRFLAKRYAIKIDSPREVCFAWEMLPLDRAKVLAAMQVSLHLPDVQITLVNLTFSPVPRGFIAFPREWLGKPASAEQPSPVLWRGEITYAGSRHFEIWAKVRIIASAKVIIATEMLKPQQPIRAEQLRIEQKDLFPDPARAAVTLDDVVGLVPLRFVPAGAAVRLDNLVRPNDVSRGDLVAIEVHSGSTRLTLSGRAEAAGRTGDIIAIRNPESNKVFRARISAKDKAIVDADAQGGN